MFLKKKHLSFRAKLLLSIFGLNLLVGVSIIVIAYNDIIKSQKELFFQNIASLAFSISEQIKPALEFDDKKTIEEIIEGILSYPATEFVGIWKSDPFNPSIKENFQINSSEANSSSTNYLYFSKAKQEPAKYINEIELNFAKKDFIEWQVDRLDIGKVIFSGNLPTGYLYLSQNLDSFLIFQQETKHLLITCLLIYLISTLLISFWIEKTLTKPLIELVNVAEQISIENNLLVRAKKMSNDEFGKLTTIFNKMLDSIRDTNNELISSNKDMEKRVIERTKDLDQANQKLQSEMQARIEKNKEIISLQNQMSKQQRLASVGQVSSNIAHELRNPMAAIRNSVYFLRKSIVGSDKSAEHLDLIDHQLSESDEVIRRLLEVTKEKSLKLSTVQLRQLCDEALAVLGISEKIIFSYNSEPDDITVSVDKILFRQVLLNLFLNSVQATDTNSKTKISIKSHKMKEWIIIEVSDNGSGIPKEIKKRVFDPLFSSREDGFGLGLSLCSDLLARHKGTIEIKETTPSGTTFLIRIPDLEHL